MAAKHTLYIRVLDTSKFKKHQTYHSYLEAGLAGQIHGGPRGFHIDSGNYIPSRSEQLLEADAKPVSQKNAWRQQLTAED